SALCAVPWDTAASYDWLTQRGFFVVPLSRLAPLTLGSGDETAVRCSDHDGQGREYARQWWPKRPAARTQAGVQRRGLHHYPGDDEDLRPNHASTQITRGMARRHLQARRIASSGNQLLPHCLRRRVSAIMNTQLDLNFLQVTAHRLFTDAE